MRKQWIAFRLGSSVAQLGIYDEYFDNDDLSVQGLPFSCEQRRNTTGYHQRGGGFLRPSEVAVMISNSIF